jgi:penicillin-binding protein-related factor A (putative recombinase)
MSEKQLQRVIVETLNYSGALCWITNAGMTKTSYRLKKGKRKGQLREYMICFGPAGMSDIIGVYKGKFLAIEVKLPERRKNVTEIQNNFIENIRDHGGLAGMATSVEEALEIINIVKGTEV